MFCPSCGKDTLVLNEPVYDGFTRIGERTKCAICGHEFDIPDEASEEESSEDKKLPSIFSEDDRPEKINLFGEDENRVLCRHCKHYTVNPFRQWCGHHAKEVEATDTCDQFEAKEEEN